MKNKQLKKAMALGTLGAVSVSTVVNPIASAYAEQVPSGGVQQDDSEEPIDGNDNETDNPIVNNDEGENGNEDVNNPTTNDDEDGDGEGDSTNVDDERVYTVDDIGLSASLTDGITIENGVMSFIRGTGEGISIATTVLDGSVNISELKVIYEGQDLEDSFVNTEESSSFGRVLDFSVRQDIEITGLTLNIILSNGQCVVVNLADLIPELQGVTTIEARRVTFSDLDFSASLIGNAVISGDTVYFKDTDEQKAGISLTAECDLPNISINYPMLGVYSDASLRMGIFHPARGGQSIINFSTLLKDTDGDLNYCKLSASITDAQGVTYEVAQENVDTFSNVLGFDTQIFNIVEDTTAPAISFGSTTAELKSLNNKDYVVKDGIYTFNVADSESGLGDEVSVKVTDTDTDVAYTYDKAAGTVSINTNQFADGVHSITITVSDAVGNEGTLDYTLNVQKETPPIKGYAHSNVSNESDSSYVKDTLKIYVGADPTDTMVKSIKLYRDGQLYAENGTSDREFIISDSGTYTLRVEDKVGNATTYRLSELFADLNDTIIIDSANPTCTTKILGGTKVGDWYTGDNLTLSVSVADETRLKNVKVVVNSKLYNFDVTNNSTTCYADIYLHNIATPKDGIYTVSITATDFAGHEYKLDSFDIKYDYTAPSVDLSATGNFVESNNNIYIDGSIIVGEENNCTDASGIQSIELLKDDEVVSNSVPFETSESGKYSVRVTDNVGLSTTVSLSDLLGTTSNNFIFDSSAPVMTRVLGYTPDSVIDGVNWYTTEPEFKIMVQDDNLQSVQAKVDGAGGYSVTKEEDCYVIKTTKFKGNATLTITARDYYGHVSTDVYNYSVDGDAPVVTKATLSADYVERGGKLYFKSTPTLSIEATDDGVGIESFNITGDRVESNTSGVFTLGSGEYYIEIKDKLGNTTGVISVAELLGLPSNVFVIDSSSPTISTQRPAGDTNGWYANDVKYSIDLADDIGIKSATVSINDQVVESYTLRDDEDVKNFTAYADTSRVKPDANGMYQIKVDVVDKSGNSSTWSDTIYVDKTAPTVDKFIFTGNGSQEGVEINGTSRYGFFFDGEASCEIHVSDGTVSSGLSKLYVTLENQDGSKTEQTVDISSGVATVAIPNNFKGFISAYAVDNVGNTGSVNQPDGVITEDSNCFINSLSLGINLPETSNHDLAGIPLYNKDITATAEIGCNYSGIKNIKWGIGESTLGNVDVDSNGNPSGDTVAIKQMGKNLVLNLSQQLNIQGNSNGQTVWIEVTDRTGHTSSTSRTFSIDKDVPTIEVSYDTSNSSNYYNQNRVAKITVKERNFDASNFKISGVSGTLGNWSNDGNTWYNTITFSEDGEYQFSLDCTDRAGNSATTYSSEKFVVDKTAPVLSVNWSSNNPSNGNFYKDSRTATVTVVDKNFDASLYSIQGSGTLSGWSTNGDTHTATISFDSDGEYEFSILGQDLAGNKSETYTSGKFIIDKSAPTLEIQGIQDMVSYKEDVRLAVKISDSYIDTTATSVTLEGKRNGSLRLVGTLNEQTGEFVFNEFPMDEKYDDIYTLKATVVDKAGNVIEKNVTFSVNRFGSVYTFTNSDMLNTYLNKARDVEIIESNVDKLDTSKAKVSVILDGTEVDVKDNLISISESEGEDGKYNYTYQVNKKAFDTDGKYLIQVYSHAEEGTDYSSVSEEYSFVLDTAKPEIIVSGVESNKRYHEYDKKVTIDVRDMSGVSDIHATLNGKDIELDKANGVYSFKVLENADAQNLSVTVTDLAGNESTVEVSNFLVTSNIWVFLTNQLWFKLGIGALIAFITAIIALLVKNRHAARKEENEVLRQNMELYRASSSTSTGGSASGERDLVQDLEKTDEDSEN